MLTALTIVLTIFGLMVLSRTMERHRARSGVLRHKRSLRIIGSSLLATALISAVLEDGLARGLLLWLGAATFGTLSIAMALAVRSK